MSVRQVENIHRNGLSSSVSNTQPCSDSLMLPSTSLTYHVPSFSIRFRKGHQCRYPNTGEPNDPIHKNLTPSSILNYTRLARSRYRAEREHQRESKDEWHRPRDSLKPREKVLVGCWVVTPRTSVDLEEGPDADVDYLESMEAEDEAVRGGEEDAKFRSDPCIFSTLR